METAVIVIVAVAILIAVCAWLLVRAGRSLRIASRRLDKDWSDIEALVKQRNNNLPRLIQTCRSYMPAQQPSLALLAEARNQQQKTQSAGEKVAANEKTRRAIELLLRDADHFDGLRRNSTFLQLQNTLMEIDERIAERRDAFNSDADRYNQRLTRFPGRLYAGKGKLQPREPWRDSA